MFRKMIIKILISLEGHSILGRFFSRDRRKNGDQKIQPPFQNNLIHDDESYEIDGMEVEDLEPDIDQLDDLSSPRFLTKYEYHYAKMVDYHGTYYFE